MDYSILNILYNQKREDSKLRKYMVIAYALAGLNSICTAGHQDSFPWAFLFDILQQVNTNLETFGPVGYYRKGIEDLDLCEFHEHVEGSTCKTLNQSTVLRQKSRRTL